MSSFNKLLLQKEELEQKHVHLLQVVESEKTAKWQYTQQCEELSTEIKKLRNEVRNENDIQQQIEVNTTNESINQSM